MIAVTTNERLFVLSPSASSRLRHSEGSAILSAILGGSQT